LAGRFKTFRNRLAKAFSRNRSHLIIVLDAFMNLVLTAKKKNNYYVQESVGQRWFYWQQYIMLVWFL
jgi:hypothetical protein